MGSEAGEVPFASVSQVRARLDGELGCDREVFGAQFACPHSISQVISPEGIRVVLLGTAHVSEESAREARELGTAA